MSQSLAVYQTYPWLTAQWQQWQQLSGRLGHAYLFAGPKGIGINEFVKEVAHAALCKQPHNGQACGQCSSCHLFVTQQHPDFFELRRLEEKKDISVDQVRSLIYKLNETSHQGGYKVTWIEGVEYLNQSAFNALLKTLEEPAKKTLFLLSTHQVDRLPPTIKSRCQQLNFTTPAMPEAISWLHAQYPQGDDALIKRALRLNWGAPLQALEWIQAGMFDEDSQWKNDLKQIQSGRKTASQSVAEWLKWQQPERVFDYFYQWSVSAVRSVMYQTEGQTSQVTNGQVQNWLRFQQAVLTAKQNWLANANKELVLESLCLEWLSIQQSETPLQTVFQSRIQKGALA
ncbi:DNA polymerase III subunit delta' [Thiomicrorhabdus immobilis]|uniref:DNA-directed DNA polymerase n=1 Tax=Thiomicrorhabdus immobilis TaxID=2791037 RepID=A0ABN6CVW7_9GAMM|nr:DNA polymerase III subunit delta' [Thiomicrorhabdus immobilis]BCN93063.1 DNA polymerase III subunit delta' [Thiomicrorhabdus immobilis]